jgi:hypothetical protein
MNTSSAMLNLIAFLLTWTLHALSCWRAAVATKHLPPCIRHAESIIS